MYTLNWTETAQETYGELKERAQATRSRRGKKSKRKSSKEEGLFKQVHKTLQLLASNPRHPGLQTHEYHSIENPLDKDEKVFEAYAQNKTPGAYRIFWCYGPKAKQITIIAITPHP